MASGHNNNWMTTFIFNQDLRSYYFNNLLFSIIQNGVFNYDISLGTSASSNTSTLVLTIKKGTTLVFSNDYVRNSITNKYERNFGSNINNTQENDSVALIKCVARQDMTADFNFSSEATISPNVTNERLFLIAYFQYNIDSAVDITVPRFGIFKKNTEENESYFSSVLGVDAGISITEGKTTFEKNVDGNLLYIILGVIEPTGSITYTDFTEDWFKNHAFSCKGLPEYRYPMIATKNMGSTDVLYKYDKTNGVTSLYVDWEKVCINGDYFESIVDWREMYGLESQSMSSSSLSQINGNSSGNDNGLYISDTEWSKLSNGGLAVDFIFAKTINFDNTPDGAVLSFNTTSIESLPLFTYRYIDTSFTVQTITPIHYTNDSTNSYTIHLDKDTTNKERLLAFIKNRGFIKKVINNIRQDNLVEGYNSIIPVAIAIRYFGSGRTTYDGFTSRGAINPANILCLLDMASETVGINTVSSAVGDIYNVLTVIE